MDLPFGGDEKQMSAQQNAVFLPNQGHNIFDSMKNWRRKWRRIINYLRFGGKIYLYMKHDEQLAVKSWRIDEKLQETATKLI